MRKPFLTFLTMLMLSGCNGQDDLATLPGSGGTGSMARSGGFSVLGSIQGIKENGLTITVLGEDWDIRNASLQLLNSGVELQTGQQVMLFLQGDTHNVYSLTAGTELGGPIESVDCTNGTLTVHATPILLNAETVFSLDVGSSGCSSLTPGDFIRVSGVPVNGQYDHLATRISRGYANDPWFTMGHLEGLDTDQKTFSLIRPISWGNATFHGADFSANTLRNGLLIRATLAHYSPQTDGDGLDITQMQALRLESWLKPRLQSGLVMAGKVHNWKSGSTSFAIANRPITFSNQTKFADGLIPEDIDNDVQLHVEGKINTDGILEATVIRPPSDGS